MATLLLLLMTFLSHFTRAAVDPRAILCVPSAAPCQSPASSSGIWCVPILQNSPANKYIISMTQSDPAVIDSSECLGRSVTEQICNGLKTDDKFLCDGFWRNGMSGSPGSTADWTSPLTVTSLKETILGKAIVLSGQCANTLLVNVTADTLAII